jgi:subtilisin family serine protease
MRRGKILLAAAALAVVTASFASPATAAAEATDPDLVPGRYIVVLEAGAQSAAVASAHEALYGVDVTHIYRHALQGYSAAMSAATADTIAALPGVDWVEQDRKVYAAAQTLPTGINRVDADLSPTAAINGADTRVAADVAVLDTGVSYNHPDLNVNTAGGRNCILSLLNANDDHGHGSHVAGTIGALDNSAGVVGVAPGARIWPVKVLSAAGSGLVSQIVCGIDYVTANAGTIDVANMSLTGGGSDDNNCGNTNNDSEHRAICASVAAGVTYVVAAGNNSANAQNSIPAAYNEVITVSSLADFNGQPGGGAAATCTSDQDDTFSSFSNFGADVDIIAPGSCIYSTTSGSSYTTMSGTSMASPHVAGAAALYRAVNPTASPATVRSALISAGSTNWTNSDDPDGIKEPLLNVATF